MQRCCSGVKEKMDDERRFMDNFPIASDTRFFVFNDFEICQCDWMIGWMAFRILIKKLSL